MAVAQLVESRIVIPVVVGSSPISHPKIFKSSHIGGFFFEWLRQRPKPDCFQSGERSGARKISGGVCEPRIEQFGLGNLAGEGED